MTTTNMSKAQILELVAYFQAKYDANPSKMNACALRLAISNAKAWGVVSTYTQTTNVKMAKEFKSKDAANAAIITGTAPMVVWISELSSYVLMLRNACYVNAIVVL